MAEAGGKYKGPKRVTQARSRKLTGIKSVSAEILCQQCVKADKLIHMKNVLAAFLLIFAMFPAWGEQVKVLKVKGNKAIIKVPPGTMIEKGRIYTLDTAGDRTMASEGDASSSATSVATGPRTKLLGLTAKIFTGSTRSSPGGTSVSTTQFEVEGRYGWNDGKREYGPIGILDYVSFDRSSSRVLAGGAFYDYNLVPNVPGTAMAYGLGAVGTLGLLSATVGSESSSGSQVLLGGGGQIKWFPFGNSACVRGDGQIRYIREAIGNVTNTTFGFFIGAGLLAYF